jgi:predicted ATPase
MFDSDYKALIKKVNRLLATLNIGYSFVLKRITHPNLNELLFVVKIKDKATKEEYHFSEVGFGLSQIIPIIFGICVNKTYEKQLYIIEQPEIHLHPEQQVKLSNLFFENLFLKHDIDDFFYSEFDKKNTPIENNYYVIETHSEHLIRGFQLLVAKGKLLPNQLGIYYVDKNKYGVSSIKDMKINERGLFIDEWPEGFFDQHYKLAKELLFAGKN